MKLFLIFTSLLLINYHLTCADQIKSSAVLNDVLKRFGTEFKFFFDPQKLQAAAEQGYRGELLRMREYVGDLRCGGELTEMQYLMMGLTRAYNFGSALKRSELAKQWTRK